MADRKLLLTALALTACSFACRATPAPPKEVSADTWAVVDGREIKKADVDKAYQRAKDSAQVLSSEEEMTAKLSLLNDLIVQDILLTKATTLKVEVPQAEVDTAYSNASKNIANAEFQQELSRRGLTPADIRDGIRRELLAEKVITQEVSSKITVSDQEVQDFFNANRAQFNIAEEAYHVAQIVVTPVRDPQAVPTDPLVNEVGPDLVIDGTERRRQRPKDGQQQRESYSGKKKSHTDKNILLANAHTTKVVYLSPTEVGKTHDKKMVDQQPIAYPTGATLGKDTGFQVYEPPGVVTYQPKKSQKVKT